MADMYVPRANVMAAEEVARLVAEVGAAELVTAGPDFPLATRMPVLWDGDRLLFHMAWANPHWRSITEGMPALAVVTGTEAYVSPSFYPAKAEHGRVVPTWNYSAVHVTGHLTVHHDTAWLRGLVTRLTEVHESSRAEPWSVDDAPQAYLDQQLKAIVGIEMTIVDVEAKAKRSQNRSAADRAGVVAGLRATGRARDAAMAAEVSADLALEPVADPPGGEAS